MLKVLCAWQIFVATEEQRSRRIMCRRDILRGKCSPRNRRTAPTILKLATPKIVWGQVFATLQQEHRTRGGDVRVQRITLSLNVRTAWITHDLYISEQSGTAVPRSPLKEHEHGTRAVYA